jgi:hypothetical protein
VWVQRWEYRVVSFRAGGYTAALNDYARDGWELFAVTPDAPRPPAPEGGRSIPMPRMVSALEDAAAKLDQIGETPQEPPGTALLWVLRRAVDGWSAPTEEA